eukprot:TRINITY_DN51543_c0_g1_i1.p1 TRINITY_DN51543_c0_g1~~TRINITY_DN51543_c0_g1_i1.p1  ORF type:complete len:381 (+),score=68.44 TRINITY_DN51543_c0_g1_i1:96-1238(+)
MAAAGGAGAVQRAGVYTCRQAARCVTPVPPPGGNSVTDATGHHRFMVGTCSLQGPNEIHVVDFVEDTAEVVCQGVLPHEEEIWLLNASPTDGRSVLTYSAGRSNPQLRLWRTPLDLKSQEGLQHVSNLIDDETPFTTVKSALWDPHSEGNVVVADAEALRVFQSGSSGQFSKTATVHIQGQRCNAACMDPHHPKQVSTVDDTHLKTWDLRQSKLAFKKEGAHLFGARDVDYNPNVPYQVVTCGEDSTLRFWDLRQLGKCRKVLTGGHHHWILRARFNSYHDQLVLSCGTDSAVCLWRAGSVASAPLGASDSPTVDRGSAEKGPPPDGLVRRCEDHDDSVYSCCWSASDAWVFASISYDGKLAVNRVPDEEKYRILLEGRG